MDYNEAWDIEYIYASGKIARDCDGNRVIKYKRKKMQLQWCTNPKIWYWVYDSGYRKCGLCGNLASYMYPSKSRGYEICLGCTGKHGHS